MRDYQNISFEWNGIEFIGWDIGNIIVTTKTILARFSPHLSFEMSSTVFRNQFSCSWCPRCNLSKEVGADWLLEVELDKIG